MLKLKRSLALGVTIAMTACATSAMASDHVVPGKLLSLVNRDHGRGSLMLELRDPSIPIPAVDGPDDPSLVGIVFTIFGGGDHEVVSRGPGPGRAPLAWATPRVTPRAVTFAYSNPRGTRQGAVRSVFLRSGGIIKYRVASALLNLIPPENEVAVRIEYGSVRVCALFAGTAVRFNDTRRFVARDSDSLLPDCSDASLAR